MDDGTEGELTAMSWALKWREEEKLDRLGTVNSDARRKPKYPKEQAASKHHMIRKAEIQRLSNSQH